MSGRHDNGDTGGSGGVLCGGNASEATKGEGELLELHFVEEDLVGGYVVS